MTEEERHRAPALWVVVGGLLVAVGAAFLVRAGVGLMVLAVTLAGAAVARLLLRGRRPEGVAVRSTWQDAAVLLALAAAIATLALTPGVSSGTGGVSRTGQAAGEASSDVEQGRPVGRQERVSSSSVTMTVSSVTTTVSSASSRSGLSRSGSYASAS